MIGFLIVILLIGITVYLNMNNKSTVAPIMIMVTLSPEIKFGAISFDSLYMYIIVLFIYIWIVKGKIFINKTSRYTVLLLFNLIMCLVSWMLFSRNDIITVVTYSLGIIKYIVLIGECWTLNRQFQDNILIDLFWYITIVVFSNTIFLLFQKNFFTQSLNILKEILSSNEYAYAISGTFAGRYTRYGGFFKYPMHLGLFSTLSFAFLLGFKTSTRKKTVLKILILCCTLFNGIMSSTKSFFIGAVIVYIVYVIQNFVYVKNRRSIYISMITLFTVLFLYLFRYQLLKLIDTYFGAYASYYANAILDFFNNTASVFSTRLGEHGAITSLLQVVKENILFGVGPSSIQGESVMDNALLVILHNGGIVSLLSVFWYYFETLKQLMKSRESFLLIVAILACGMGFQIWIASPLTLWAYYYFDIKINCIKNRS